MEQNGEERTPYVPEFDGNLRKHMIKVPAVIAKAGGIRIFGKLIRSLIFSTDVALIKNCNADAVIAVYPFTPQPIISQAIIEASDAPVFCGIGGGTTTGKRVVNLGMDAEFRGAMAVVVNAPTTNAVIADLRKRIDIPIVVTVVTETTDIEARLAAGADIVNISGAGKTIGIVSSLRARYPTLPIIATGGPNDATILQTIEAGANAITYTPPTSAEIFKRLMDQYRKNG